MESAYIRYFEGYAAAGHLICKGNGAATLEHENDECIDPAGLKDQYYTFLLKRPNGLIALLPGLSSKPSELVASWSVLPILTVRVILSIKISN
ncbi:TPA: hypothetical protein L9408_003740 [Klebsiella pneumoniae]|uniref:hypothetical protein n=1 Tax=Klebsiella TaxID=570 RepID=UPI00115A7069|nr:MULTISPECIES: hypothetical protein [Klebsiella]MDK1899584.1 hypothetical protein [Klebsiella sp. K4-172]MDZ0124541.1 hypothetical protein [Klebsiella pneumoniae]HBR7746167.1 hypothetical protein [Klebsiella pneumoniae]HBU2244958.1 hypothetical protein [Klebsiella pneumoniae]HCF6566017.1 hypothetical protein [Klebsiella pneumoniae]